MDIHQIIDGAPKPADLNQAIRVDQMPQQLEVREPEDDWTGMGDPKERRKLQNRLNQRLWRKRQRDQKVTKNKPGSIKALVEKSSDPRSHGSHDISPSSIEEWFSSEDIARSIAPTSGSNTPKSMGPPPLSTRSLCRGSLKNIQEMVSDFEKWAHQNYLMGSPRIDLLLTLIQFNVFRALLSNTTSLGFGMEWLLSEDAISPFNTTTPATWASSLPECLRPTELQHAVDHHPWIDLFPIPAMRDNILRAGTDYDDSGICEDIVEISDKPKEKAGLIVWGEPWDIHAWEASPAFLRKWGWVVEGCHELFQSTNYWRTQRGERIIEL